MEITKKLNEFRLESLPPAQMKASAVYSICECCGKDTKECIFVYNEYASPIEGKNRFETKCFNWRCNTQKKIYRLPDVKCKKYTCVEENNVLEFNFVADDKQEFFVEMKCRECGDKKFSPYGCINIDCYFPLVILNRGISDDTISLGDHKNYICENCFADPNRGYMIQISKIDRVGKESIYDPTLSRSYRMTCPKCVTVGCVAQMDHQSESLFDYIFYCTNPVCFYWWKINYLLN
jgi:hypothetical protein